MIYVPRVSKCSSVPNVPNSARLPIVPSPHPPESSPGSGYRSCQPRLLPLTGAHYCHSFNITGACYCHHNTPIFITPLTSHRATLLSLSFSLSLFINIASPSCLSQEHIIVTFTFYQHSLNTSRASSYIGRNA